MRKNAVFLIWAAGIVLTLALYEAGPDRVARMALLALGDVPRLLADAVDELAARFHALMRALTLALFAVFLALAALAARRGQRVRWTLAVVCALFFALLYRPLAEGFAVSGQRWLGAFLLAAGAAAVMTRRLASGGAR